MSARRRAFLFLQGPLSPLYRRLAASLAADGHRVRRINLNVGDWLQWHGRETESYRGPLCDWPAYVSAVIEREAITDVVLHNHMRPYHAAALNVAAAHRVTAHVTELGLLRAGFMTLIQGPAGALPQMPRSPVEIRRLARDVQPIACTRGYPHAFWRVAAPDVVYNLSQTALSFLYPRYERHTIYFPPIEYAAWLGRLATAPTRGRRAARLIADLRADGAPSFVFPLQLEGDFQIRVNAPFAGQQEAIFAVVASFARHAPPNAHLILKSHPLDNGLERWGDVIRRVAARLGVTGRVHFADGGSLDDIWEDARGVITINSTAGLEAVLKGLPVLALAPAVYAVEGLVYQGSLDAFWTEAAPPDAGLARAFVSLLTAQTQVRGSIYDPAGLDDAVANMAARLGGYRDVAEPTTPMPAGGW